MAINDKLKDSKPELDKTKQPSTPPLEPLKLDNPRLNIAAEQIISTLPDHVSEIIEALAKEYSLQLWHLVAGVLLEVYSEGRLSSFQIYPDWQDGAKQTMGKCEECKEEKPLDLANISGEYKRDINDYEWLCRRCHMESDGRLQKFINQAREKKV